MSEARIDKWMWAVRIFKTRTIAAEACKKGRISINGALAKAARMVKPGEVIHVRNPPGTELRERDAPPKRIAVNWKTSLRLNSWMTLILISTLKNNIQV